MISLYLFLFCFLTFIYHLLFQFLEGLPPFKRLIRVRCGAKHVKKLLTEMEENNCFTMNCSQVYRMRKQVHLTHERIRELEPLKLLLFKGQVYCSFSQGVMRLALQNDYREQ